MELLFMMVSQVLFLCALGCCWVGAGTSRVVKIEMGITKLRLGHPASRSLTKAERQRPIRASCGLVWENDPFVTTSSNQTILCGCVKLQLNERDDDDDDVEAKDLFSGSAR
jgi:hypothetical protein